MDILGFSIDSNVIIILEIIGFFIFLGLLLYLIKRFSIKIEAELLKTEPTIFIAFGFALFVIGFFILLINESFGLSAISVGLALISVGLGLRALKLGDDSDKQMRTIANATFLRLTSDFENERYRIRNTHPVSESIWKSLTFTREAVTLKEYVNEENQRVLLVRCEEFFDELYHIGNNMTSEEKNGVFNEERNNQLKNIFLELSELSIFPEYSNSLYQSLFNLEIEIDDFRSNQPSSDSC